MARLVDGWQASSNLAPAFRLSPVFLISYVIMYNIVCSISYDIK
jgi:hypothetical protein